MFGKREQVKLQRILTRPTEVDIKQFADAARKDRNIKFNYFWTRADNQDFMLSVKYAETTEGILIWRFYFGSGSKATELWFHLTTNLQQIYAMIVNSMGEDLAKATRRDASVTMKVQVISEQQNETPEHTFDGKVNKVPINELQKLYQDVALNGELAVVHTTNLLQSLQMGNVSGRLKIQGIKGTVEIFFENGAPVHARGTNGEGLECLLQVIGWSEGKFQFESQLKTDTKSIQMPLSAVIMHGTHLVDNTNYLLALGIRNDTVLTRKNPKLAEAEFEQMITKESADMALSKSLYMLVDDRRSLSELITTLQLPRSKWVHVVAALVRSGAIAVYQPREGDRSTTIVAAKQLDSITMDLFARGLTKVDSGLFTYGAFLFLLQHDLALREGTDRPLSLVIFEVQNSRGNTTGALIAKNAAAPNRELIKHINALKPASGTLAHYERTDFAIILPDLKPAVAAALCESMRASILADPTLRGLDSIYGVSSVPKDTNEMPVLLAAAEVAKKQARNHAKQVVIYNQNW